MWCVSNTEPQPTFAHCTLAELCAKGYLKYLVTTNGGKPYLVFFKLYNFPQDGLHLVSGIPVEKLSELHGSVYKRRCTDCGARICLLHVKNRNKCEKCGGDTESIGVAFGAQLPDFEWLPAKEHSQKCELALAMGTSLRVSPACNLVEHSYHNGGHLVIVNLQVFSIYH